MDIVKALGTDDERLLATRGPGTSQGKMSLFTLELRRTASGRAHTRLRLLEIRRQDLEDLPRRQPDLAYAMLGTLSRRLEQSENHTIADLREKNRLRSKPMMN